jgi:hypothetical protein
VVSRNAPKRIIQQSQQHVDQQGGIPMIPSVIFEDSELKAQIVAQKAMAIVQQALSSGSVLFSLPKGLFGDRFECYKIIQEQISRQVEFRPLSLYNQRSANELLIEAKFESVSDATTALKEGITVNGVVYKAYSTKETTVSGSLKHVQLTILRMTEKTTFLSDLMSSLEYYGKVLQVKKYTRNGFFEGHVSVLLDTSVGYKDAEGKLVEAKPLERMLYMCEWDCFAVAAFRGAPPVCHFCRQSGHIRAACPTLAKRKCFACGVAGHTARFCKVKKSLVSRSEGEDLDAYLRDSKASTKVTNATNVVLEKEDLSKCEGDEEEGDNHDRRGGCGESEVNASEDLEELLGDSDEDVESSNVDVVGSSSGAMEVDPVEEPVVVIKAGVSSSVKKVTRSFDDPDGTSASKYASASIRSTMDVDSPKEMLALSSVNKNTVKKMESVRSGAKLVSPKTKSSSAMKGSSSSKSSLGRAHRA